MRRAGALGRWILPLVALYVAALIALVLLFRIGGDQTWWVTVAFYAPRWIWVVPWPPLLFLAAIGIGGRRRLVALGLLLAALPLAGGPLLGFVMPRAGDAAGESTRVVRVLTANVEREAGDGPGITAAIARERPDIVMLQEWEERIDVAWPAGWRVVRQGPELLIASRFPFEEAAVAEWPDPPGEPVNMALAVVRTDFGPLRLLNLHLTSPRIGLGEIASRRTLINPGKAGALDRAIAARRDESARAAAYARVIDAPLLVVGDFNMPDDSRIYRDTWSGFTNAFRAAGSGFGATVRAALGPIPIASRIDHQLGGAGWRCRSARVGPDVGSDHRPLIAEWEWTGPPPAPRPPAAPDPPSGAPGASGFDFDATPTGALPPGWQLWRNGRLARAGVAAETSGRGRVLALDTDDSGADVRAWIAGPAGGTQELVLDLRLDSLNPIRLLVCGRDFDTRVPSGRGIELIRGMEARLLSLEPDSARGLARVRSREWQESDWLRVTLRSVGERLAARIERPEAGTWLTAEGEWAPGPPEWTLEARGLPPPPGVLVGVWRVFGYTGAILTDQWKVFGEISPEPTPSPR